MLDLETPLELAPWVCCTSCNVMLPFSEQAFEPYFRATPLVCPKCGAAIDWWRAMREAILDRFQLRGAATFVGARTTNVAISLAPNESKEVDLTKYGVPAAAEILHMNLTSNGSAWPLMVHGNDALLDPIGPKFWLFGRPLPDDAGDGPLSISATWFARSDDDTTVRHLVEAARDYTARRYDAVVVPANIAAEASIARAVASAMRGFASNENTEKFLQDAATYSHQLNVLLPMLAFFWDAPKLPDHVRGLLNRLRGLRNKIAHEGRCEAQTKESAADHLTAAIFGVRYAISFGEAVEAARLSGKLPPRPLASALR